MESLAGAEFYAELGEAEALLGECRPPLTSPDLGSNKDSTQALLKKLGAIERDVTAFQTTVEALEVQAAKLADKGHYDGPNLRAGAARLRRLHNELGMLCVQRDRRLQRSVQLYRCVPPDNKTVFVFFFLKQKFVIKIKI